MGAAPRHRGKSEPCRLIEKTSERSSDDIFCPNAITTNTAPGCARPSRAARSTAAAAAVRDGAQGYDWDCTPGRWLLYTLLLAMPFPAVAVRPDPHTPVWQRHVRPTRKQQPDLRDMPILLPEISDAQYRLPVLVGSAPWHRTVYCTLARPFARCEHRRNDVEHSLSLRRPRLVPGTQTRRHRRHPAL